MTKPSIQSALKRRFQCDHIKQGALVAKVLDTPYGLVAVCDKCEDSEFRLTDEGQVITFGE